MTVNAKMEPKMTDELPTLKITRADINDRNEYIGATDVSDYAGHIDIDADLGWVIFTASIGAKGHILSLAGSGIEAGDGIKAGDGIEAGWGIEAGLSITAKWLSARLRIFAGLCAWRLPTPEETEIRAEVRGGAVAFGTVVAPVEGADAEPLDPGGVV